MSKLKILIVEDELLVSTDIEESLLNMGYDVLNAVATGKAALREVEKCLPDVILMDIMLKGDLTGIETATLIKQKHDVPIIYLTANADMSTINKAKISLPYGYIIKPFTDKDLQTNIEIARFKFENDLKMKMESDQFNQIFGLGKDKKEHIIIQGKNGLERIRPDDIYFIEGTENGSIFHLLDDEITSEKRLDKIGELFPGDDFMQINEMFIVNIKKIFVVKFPEIIIADKMRVLSVDDDKKKRLEAQIQK
ncbi:MAG: response regulator [Mariniphaga sp.]